MAENAKHNSSKDKSSFNKGDKEVPRKSGASTVKSTAKTREATRSKGGRREREVK